MEQEQQTKTVNWVDINFRFIYSSVYAVHEAVWKGLRVHEVYSANVCAALRKHAYSKLLIISPPKNENFQIKKYDIFHISAQNIDCGYSLEPPRRGGSNEFPQFMFWAEIRKK